VNCAIESTTLSQTQSTPPGPAERCYVLGCSPDASPFSSPNPASHRSMWSWILASKQVFDEARAQSCRDARLVSKDSSSVYNPSGTNNYHTGLPNSERSFPFADPEHVQDWSIKTRIHQCENPLRRFDQAREDAPSYPIVNRYHAGTVLAVSSFRANPNCLPGYIESVAPSLRILSIHIGLAGSLGA
jgi:hypothetical protein